MVMATNQGMFTNQSSAPSSGFVYAVGNRTFNTAEEAKQYLARNPGAGTISRVPFQNVTGPTTSGPFNVPTTPTGQQRGGGMMQNITTTAPTKQAPIIVGTPAPTSTTKRTAGDTGPIIANPGGMLPIPPATTKTPEPTKQAPIIVGTPDPVKTTKGTYESPPIIPQPGQIPFPGPGETVEEDETRATEQFDEMGQETTPPPPPSRVDDEGVIEEGTETRATEQFDEMGEEEPEEITTFTFVEGRERVKKDAASYLFNQAQPEQVTVDELRAYFNDPEKVNRLPEVFGTFDNYLAYMTEREQLIRSGEYDLGNWGEAREGVTQEQLMLLEGEDIWIDPTSGVDTESAERNKRYAQRSAYERWIASDVNKALLQKYGVSPTVYSDSGDKFQWNGSGYVKTHDVKGAGFGDYFKAAIGAIVGYYLGPALSSAFSGSAGAGTAAAASSTGAAGATAGATTGATAGTFVANYAASAITNAVTQLITTGGVDLKDALKAGATSVLSTAAMDYLEQSGVLKDVNSAFDSTSTDQLLDVDGNVIGEIIRDNQGNIISSSGISSNNWLNYAYEFGGTINEGISYSNLLSNVLDVIPEWVYDAGFETAQAAYDAMQEAGVIAAPSSMGQEGSSSIFRGLEAVGNVVDIFDETGQQAEQQEEQEEDILADTTEESSIIEDLFNDYMEDFRVEFEGQQNITIEQVQEVVANLLGGIEQPETLTEEEIEQIVSGAVSSIPQADTLSEEQIDTLVNSAINSVRIDLETAETERQEIRAGQEAIRSELSGDIQSLEERFNNLPPEIREIVAEQLENLEITEDISSVRQAITALEEVVSNIQPGTTPEQVEEQIEQADLVTSEQLETTAEGLFAAIQAMAEGQTVELTTAQSQLLAEIAQGDAETIERLSQFEGQLEDYLEERNITFDTVTGELSSDIERLEEQAAEFETRTEERFEESAQERAEIYQGLLNRLDEFRQGTEVDLSETEIRVLSEVTGVEERLLQQASENAEEFNALLAEQGIQFEEVTDSLRADIAASEQRTGERIVGLEERMDANAIQQLSQLTGLRTEFLETLSASEAAAIARNQGLSDQIAEQITGIRGETAAQIEGINERLTERINEYETLTGEQLEIAEEQRAALGGQLGTLTTDVAQVIEDVIRANGRIEDLDEAARLRYEELGLSIEDLSSRIGVNLEALQEGILTQESAMRELIEETTQQTEESLTQRLEEAEQGFATSLSNTEANLLSQITGIESGVLQQIAEVEGGLQEQFGEGFGQVQDQVAGIGEGLGELGQTLGTGLLGLAAAQPTAQQIASAMPRQPVKFDPFLKGLSPFQPLTPLSLSPVQEKDALSELNKFIGRQSGMLV